MPTQSSTYNSRVTSEALEKKFRDTFTSQAGSELLDDLYAQGVIVPTVDFTAAALGSELPQYLQTAWDFSTTHNTVSGGPVNIISGGAGFYKIDLLCTAVVASGAIEAKVFLTNGIANKVIWEMNTPSTSVQSNTVTQQEEFYVFIESGFTLTASTDQPAAKLDICTRQVADLYGNLVNPTNFFSQ